MSSGSRVNVRMGELVIAREGELFTLLGSCVAIVLYNRKQPIGGLAHAVLPVSGGDTHAPGKFVDTAIVRQLGHRDTVAAGPGVIGRPAFQEQPVGERDQGGRHRRRHIVIEHPGVEAAEARLAEL